jgi:glycerophosphoryl diester phosphodiesterase
LKEIRSLDAGAWKDAKFAGEKVLTFQEMIDLVRGKAGIIPETKAPGEYAQRGLSMEKAVMAVLKKNKLDLPGADPKTPVIIQSFSEESLKLLRKEHVCKLPLAYLFSSPADNARLQEIAGFADGIAPNKGVVLARPEIVAEAHKLKLSVTIWTCRSGSTGKFPNVKDEMAHFLKLGVDAIFTDNPDQFPRK